MIETSAKAGVSELKFGGLHVKFGRPADEPVPPLGYPFMPQPQAQHPVTDLTEKQHVQQTKAAIEHDEILLREEQLARLLVEDPAKYEELLRDGELADALDGADDSDDAE